MSIQKKALFILCSATLMQLTACGGGGGGGGSSNTTPPPPPPATASGVFKDANVAGLKYVSGAQNGVTGVDGSFTYEVGKTVTFSIGGVTLGTANGKSLITPVDLVSGGTGSSLQVQNIVRFLMMLDTDGDARNGITISEAMRNRASSWGQVDFNAADITASSVVTAIQADAVSTDGTQHLFPLLSDAQAHLEASFRCAYSGYFHGSYGSADQGSFNAFINAAGFIHGFAHSMTTPGLILAIYSANAISAAQSVAFVAGPASNGTTFNGSFSNANAVGGNWSGAGLTGTFSGERDGAVNPVYRFTGTFSVTAPVVAANVSYFVYDIDAANNVSAISYNWGTNSIREYSPTLNGTTLTFQGTDGSGGTAQVDVAAGTLNGTWTVPGDGSAGTFTGTGCRLN